MNTAIVIEFEALHGKPVPLGTNYLIKELAIATVEKVPAVMSWTIGPPPYPELAIPLETRNSNRFVIENFHGLNYVDGDTPYYKLQTVLKFGTRHAASLYSKGDQKCAYLSNALGREVSDLSEFAAPRLTDRSQGVLKCAHPHKGLIVARVRPCALEKAAYYANFFFESREVFNMF